MVIFGKKAKVLIKRVERIEAENKQLIEANRCRIENAELLQEHCAKLEVALKELSLTVENAFENGQLRRTPSQLLREWFLGDEKEGSK